MIPSNKVILGTHIQCMKRGKRENPVGRKPPHSKYIAKVEKIQLLGSRVLHPETISQKLKLLLSDSLGEDIRSLHGTTNVLKIDDPIMDLEE